MVKRRETKARRKPATVKFGDVNKMTEAEATRIFGQATTRFMRDVAKAAKKHKIEAHAMWMYNHGTMRCCSTGVDEVGRSIGYDVALMMNEQSKALMENMARKINETKPS